MRSGLTGRIIGGDGDEGEPAWEEPRFLQRAKREGSVIFAFHSPHEPEALWFAKNPKNKTLVKSLEEARKKQVAEISRSARSSGLEVVLFEEFGNHRMDDSPSARRRLRVWAKALLEERSLEKLVSKNPSPKTKIPRV